jgi:hypothetical protein
MTDWFRELQQAQLSHFSRSNPGTASWIGELDAVYLYGTIGSEAVLLPDGRVRVWYAERWPESEEYTERDATSDERVAALVIGARRWPQLARLLPARANDAVSCHHCGGVGEIPARDGVICPSCHGLGWTAPAI